MLLFKHLLFVADIDLVDPKHVKSTLEPALHKLIADEAAITKYDTVVGDGDCGIGLKRGAEATLSSLSSLTSSDVMEFFATICPTIEKSMDGTSGALYAIFLNSLASNMRKLDTSSSTPVTTQIWAKALKMSMEDLGSYTPAQPGDRTLMDALVPFVNVLGESGDAKKSSQCGEGGRRKDEGDEGESGPVGVCGWEGVRRGAGSGGVWVERFPGWDRRGFVGVS